MIQLRCSMMLLVALLLQVGAGTQNLPAQEPVDPFGAPPAPAAPPAFNDGRIGMPNPFSAELRLPSVRALEHQWDVSGEIAFDTAITLGEMSVLAYNDEHTRRLVLQLLDFNEVVLLDDGPMSGFIAIKDDMAVVAFRGTNMSNPADWLANIDLFRQTPMHGACKFHKGFQDSYHRFADNIRRTLATYNPNTIWVTGHSLGGAMAVCCAYDLVRHQIPVTGLITFGQPRVANPAMATFLQSQLENRYLRFVNFDDIVPHVPTTKPAVLSDYRHAGELAWFKDNGIERNKLLMKAAPNDPFANEPQEPESHISESELIVLQRQLKATEIPGSPSALPPSLLSRDPIRYLGATPNTIFPATSEPPVFGETQAKLWVGCRLRQLVLALDSVTIPCSSTYAN